MRVSGLGLWVQGLGCRGVGTLARRADVESRNANHWTCLHVAYQSGSSALVLELPYRSYRSWCCRVRVIANKGESFCHATLHATSATVETGLLVLHRCICTISRNLLQHAVKSSHVGYSQGRLASCPLRESLSFATPYAQDRSRRIPRHSIYPLFDPEYPLYWDQIPLFEGTWRVLVVKTF